eukprot:jgi/Botrbrau1/12942/Bobra.154_2s0004.1
MLDPHDYPQKEPRECVLQFLDTVAATLQQITPADIAYINDIRDAFKVASRPVDEAEEGPEPMPLEDLLENLNQDLNKLIRDALECTAHAAAHQQTHHMVHFSWAPSAGVIYRLNACLPADTDLAKHFRHSAVAYFSKYVPKLVPTGTDDSPATQRASVLNAMTTSIDKATSSVLQGQGRGRDVSALQQASNRLRTTLQETAASPRPGFLPPLLKKLPFQLRTVWDLHERGHTGAEELLANLKSHIEGADLSFQIAASGYLTSALAKVATHLDRLDASVDDAFCLLKEACDRYPGRGVEECLQRTPKLQETPRVGGVDSPDLGLTSDGKRSRSKRAKERTQKLVASAVQDLNKAFKEAEDEAATSHEPATPRAEALGDLKSHRSEISPSIDDEVPPKALGDPKSHMSQISPSIDYELPPATHELPPANHDQPLSAIAIDVSPAPVATQDHIQAEETVIPLDPLKSVEAVAVIPLPPVLTSRETDSTETMSWSVAESPARTPKSHSSDEIHPDFHLLDDLNCPLKKVLMRDPVVAADGWTYEKSAILEYFETQMISPMTHKAVPHTNVIPNLMARSMLQKLLMAQRRRKC